MAVEGLTRSMSLVSDAALPDCLNLVILRAGFGLYCRGNGLEKAAQPSNRVALCCSNF